jgi:hypothetical protein
MAKLFGGEDGLDVTRSRGVRNRLAVLAEFNRRHRIADLKERTDLPALTLKQAVSLGGREMRAVARAVGRPILGGLPRTLEVEVGPGSVTLRSHTGRAWTDTQNQGGPAGHGAQMPKRETVAVEADDLEVLVELLEEHHIQAFEGAA